MGLASHLVESDSHKERASLGRPVTPPPISPGACLSGHVVCCPLALLVGLWTLASCLCLIPGGHRAEEGGGAGPRGEVVSLKTVTPLLPTPRNQAISSGWGRGGSGRGAARAMSPGGHESQGWTLGQNRGGKSGNLTCRA